MAVNHTPPDRAKVAGNRLAGCLNQLEQAIPPILNEIATLIEAIDGGEGNAADTSKMAGVQDAYNFKRAGTPANDAATAAIGQLQEIRGVLLGTFNAGNGTYANQEALKQAFSRLRG